DALAGRLDQTLADAQVGRGRTAVWHDAESVIRDFPVTGTGAGTFGPAGIAYQTAEPGYRIEHAHNHYLQLAAEGGVCLVSAALAVALAFILLFRRRMNEDATSLVLVRAGAAAGIAGAMLQS